MLFFLSSFPLKLAFGVVTVMTFTCGTTEAGTTMGCKKTSVLPGMSNQTCYCNTKDCNSSSPIQMIINQAAIFIAAVSAIIGIWY